MRERVPCLKRTMLVATFVVIYGCTPKTDEEPKPSVDAGMTADGGKVDIDSGLEPVGSMKIAISGLVTDVNGARIASADVKLGQRAIKSGSDGEFSFGEIMVNAEEVLLVSHPGYSE